MIFRAELLAKVLDGTKTMTRRHVHGRTYHVGRDYAVQPGRGKHAVARIRITENHTAFLGEISEHHARREGFPNASAFVAYWRKLYGDFNPSERVQVISFALVQDGP